MLGKLLVELQEGKDLTKIISKVLNYTKQCLAVHNKRNRLLGFIARHINNKTKDTILSLHNALVRPHLEYTVQFWPPDLVTDEDNLARLQRATQLMPSLKYKPYEETQRTKIIFTTLEI